MLCYTYSFFPLFRYFQIDAEPIAVYVPLSEETSIGPTVGIKVVSAKGNVSEEEKASAVTDTPMEGFFDGVDIIAKAMASATTATTREVFA